MAAAVATKTAWKLQEITAHSSNVSSLVLGKSSGRLLATGGDDCRVNIWSINKPNCIMSLTGHTTPVESVKINTNEELIVAGSQSGSIRIWDLEAAKILRTLMGHKANICSLDFHPFGGFVASGSMDTNIKLWDVRRKGCVFRYKGHTQAVRCLRFSPDGKWLASSADDHTVKLWDLAAGKIMFEFTGHTGPVNVVEFHPNEYLLASGSSDRTVRFWDLEKFQVVSCIEEEATPVRCVLFNPDGCCLYAGCHDTLRVYGWEPERCFDVVLVNWGKVADLSICNNQLIGVSFTQSTVSSFVVDLSRVTKCGPGTRGLIRDDKPLTQPLPAGSSLRRIYDRPTTTCSKPQRMKHNSESERRSPSSEDDREDKESTAEIQNTEDYNEIFQPKNPITRTPPNKSEPFPAPPEDEPMVAKEASRLSQVADIPTPLPSQENQPDPIQRSPIASSTPKTKVEPTVIPAARNEPIGLKASDFLPAVNNQNLAEIVDEEAMSQIRKGHETMCVVLTSRHKNLDTVRAVWSTGDIKTSVDSAVAINDLSVMVDLLNIVNQKASLWKLDLCTVILPQIEKLLQSKYESYVQTGCTSLKLILQRFLPLITDILAAPPSVGVDISREERLHKCRLCYKQLKNISNIIKNKSGLSGRHGSAFRELHLLMAVLE
uniref:katanin p80 WD40 repeat-containing subunit B1 isoform X1 n=2 Tax=Podarcis muralis TaxID=64176 RepID=UPI00109F56A7|nr:katanin p80 WD40 repeat-containing subunit B1 isoform X1 [Podarcis muralis]XP_028595212.1 katanin p80 WD40 repeat-containing subunit B1 isoform X1 [Podarcis muralis]XP_028595213.1 katanin p80 WD40 repeat-containing subunit B1 isoform X1 [Podarcis muralis]XP_028595214.1 katanin p80 WD40 repeat-containing subunit B1 isoform X1 [Podarcis muralis]